MFRKIFLFCLLLMALGQLAKGADLILTAESDKPVYLVGDDATFTGRLKNVSQVSFIEDGDVEYIFTISQNGFEICRWSLLDCG